MDEKTIRTLEITFKEFTLARQDGAALFYERLFAIEPSLRRLFAESDMKGQQTALMGALALVIGSLRDLGKIVPVLEGLGARHVAYGVEEAHYSTVGQALIETLSLTFGERFTGEVRDAWVGAYAVVSGVMIEAARRAAPMQAAE